MLTAADRKILRELAQRKAELAGKPDMARRRKLTRDINGLRTQEVSILVSPEGAWEELLPASAMRCQDPIARSFERDLRMSIFQEEHIRDDNPVTPFFNINWDLTKGSYGVEVPMVQGDNRGSYHWDPQIKDMERDFEKLRHRQPIVDRAKTYQRLRLAQETFGDLLPVRIQAVPWWTMGLTWDLVLLIGIEPLMLAMYDTPELVHKYMAFLRDDALNLVTWFEREGLLSFNNVEAGYCGSGGLALTDELPERDGSEFQQAKLRDMWGFAESQETVGISPEMFAEFVLPYQIPLLEKFGLTYYGCCEQLHHRIDHVFRVPRLRRISVSPWCDLEIMADKTAGKKLVWCRKPNPSLVCVNFNEEAIRADLRASIAAARRAGCALEIILKDTHTVQNQPWRLQRWVEIAREETARG